MANLTTYARNAYRDHFKSATPVAVPTPGARYVQIHVTDPTVAPPSTGIVGTTRQSVTLATNGNGALTNSADVVWTGMPTTAIGFYSIWDHATTGNAWFYGPLVNARSTTSGQTFRMVAGEIDITYS